MRGCHRGPAPLGVSGWCGNRHRPARAGPRLYKQTTEISADKDMSTLLESTLRRRYVRASDRLGVPKACFPYQSRPAHDGSPHVEVSDDLYHYVVTERGEELERRSTPHADELLYWLLQGVTFSLSCDFELRHRVVGKDFRRLLFAKQLELLRGLSLDWERKRAKEIERTLQQHPFEDSIDA
jgi:hypothetical protein